MEYSFAENLRQIRIKRNLSQQELADAINVGQNTVCRWENGERYPRLDKVYDIANALNVPVSALTKVEVHHAAKHR